MLWAYIHSARSGDILRLRITTATGDAIHAQDVTLERTQAQLFRATGRRSPAAGWPPGLYIGEVTLIRDGTTEIDRHTTRVVITP